MNARSDMVMAFFLTAAFVTFFQFWQGQATRRRLIYLFYCSVGLATLAKGPLGLILPGLVVVFFLGVTRELRFLRQMRLGEGAVIVLLVAASWYLLALWQGGPEFFRRQSLPMHDRRWLPRTLTRWQDRRRRCLRPVQAHDEVHFAVRRRQPVGFLVCTG